MSLVARSKDCPQMEFNIGQVVELLGLKIRRSTPDGADLDCPFCGRPKLNIHLGKNVYRCNYCGKGGGMLDLYREVRGMASRKEAFRSICEELSGGRTFDSRWETVSVRCNVVEKLSAALAPPDVIDRTYRTMLGLLRLRTDHFQSLLNRGLKPEQIEANQYRSTPVQSAEEIAPALLRAGCTLQGVPGFYMDSKGIWRLNLYPKLAGILVPVCSLDGLISGFQIRLDRPVEKRKYVWLSSANLPGGVSSGSPFHYAGERSKTVYITEGALKADVAHAILGKSFGAIAGVSQFGALRNLFGALMKDGTETVCEAYDMDCETNIHVEAARQKMIRIARQEFGFKVYSVTWNSQFKGIDDWALARKQQKI